MTGVDHHQTGLGQLSEIIRNSPAHQGKPGHEGYLNDKVVALPELLAQGGYHTMMSGKWHLGLKPEYSPKARGFARSFALLPGCANHYGYEPQYERVEEPPRFFETAVTALHSQDGEYVKTLPEDFYSSDFYAEKLVQYLDERTSEEKEKPFFAYLPFSAPHWPLQAPKESMDKFRGKYDDGPEALRLRRLERLKELGLMEAGTVPHDFVSVGREQSDWSTMTSEERAKSARSMEAYAGMVDRMDYNIGHVLDHLKASGEYDNTYIFFMSDNGAEGASYEARDVIREDILDHIDKYYDNSLENIGRKNSFVWYGNRWAQAATAPGRLYKMFSTQGGCRVPLVLKPAVGDGGGKITDAFCTVMDIVPTLLEVAGVEHPKQWKGKDILPIRGKSWTSFLKKPQLDDPFAIHGHDHVTGFECAGSGAIRRGRYKLTYVPKPHGPQRWELFDILKDPGETNDLSKEKPQDFEAMLKLWEQYKSEVGVVGLRGEFSSDYDNPLKDDFEDTGRWIRWIGKENVPDSVQPKFW
jgi:arylsulfatase A-like enzyme